MMGDFVDAVKSLQRAMQQQVRASSNLFISAILLLTPCSSYTGARDDRAATGAAVVRDVWCET